ncbi:DUF1707 domain-containing protein [Streptomyces lydicus]|uniref:DUF1707 SHOCT-like domain-containing protein n=1 Tax=Streptomyces lydicus TaxID=47763 RepID=UPI00367DDC4F
MTISVLDEFSSARHWSETVAPFAEDLPSFISEGDRDAAVQRLQEAYVQELISHEEMDERLHQVLTTKTRSELMAALAALPEKNTGTTSTIAAQSRRIQRRGA